VLVSHRAGAGAREGLEGWVAGRDVSLDAGELRVHLGGLDLPATARHRVTLLAWSRILVLPAEVESALRGSVGSGRPCTFTPALMDAEDPLFILYTSGW